MPPPSSGVNVAQRSKALSSRALLTNINHVLSMCIKKTTIKSIANINRDL